jgi:sialidase-1
MSAIETLRVPVFWSGLAHYRVFRIPVLLRMGRTLLAFAEGRPTFQDHGSIDIVLRRSGDGGRTWGAVEALLDGSSLGSRHGTTVGNPVPIYIRQRRELLLLFCSNFGSSSERAIRAGKRSGEAGRRIWLSRSFNLGKNWSSPVELTAQLKLPGWTWYAVGPGGAISLRNGTLLVPATHASRARRREIHGKYDRAEVGLDPPARHAHAAVSLAALALIDRSVGVASPQTRT